MTIDFIALTEEGHGQVLNALVKDTVAKNPNRIKPHQEDIIDPDLHDLFIGNDVIDAGAGNDTVIGDDGAFLSPVVTGERYNKAKDVLDLSQAVFKATQEALKAQQKVRDTQLRTHQAKQLAHCDDRLPAQRELELIPRDFEYDLNTGNDVIHGGDGDDVLIGDFGTILIPIVLDTPANKKKAEALEKDVQRLLKDLEHSLRSAHHHNDFQELGREFFDSHYAHQHHRRGGSDRRLTLNAGNDTITT